MEPELPEELELLGDAEPHAAITVLAMIIAVAAGSLEATRDMADRVPSCRLHRGNSHCDLAVIWRLTRMLSFIMPFSRLDDRAAADGAPVSVEEVLEHLWDASTEPFSDGVSLNGDRQRVVGDGSTRPLRPRTRRASTVVCCRFPVWRAAVVSRHRGRQSLRAAVISGF